MSPRTPSERRPKVAVPPLTMISAPPPRTPVLSQSSSEKVRSPASTMMRSAPATSVTVRIRPDSPLPPLPVSVRLPPFTCTVFDGPEPV